ncbi:hypothetical protein EVY06_02465 [Citrobacter koseri]|uniref:gp53-like domain-containing protein n=1 Tax=Citrobacter koseri TaxID=545 RepID=UPI0010203084|nr:hypothetical protein [Citrobacter koseri]RZB03354.1 hypothetical protein EVY06_02465 [Citrobacter koseri]HAZ8811476.1 hypothetical protein [Citrobacter koseri]
MATNNFKAFALDPNANVTPQADWEALPALLSGFTAGKAASAQVNKALRQSTTIAALVGQFIANSGADALDNADVNGLVTKFTNALISTLGLGTASKRNGITGSLSGTGYLKIPFLNGSTERTFIIQWGSVANGGSGTSGSATFPIVFPSAIVGGAFGPLDTENGGFSVSFSTRTLSGFTAIFRDISNAPYPHVPTRLQSSTYFVIGY